MQIPRVRVRFRVLRVSVYIRFRAVHSFIKEDGISYWSCCWKQAFKRKLGEFHIPKPLIKDLVGKNGVMNILTVVPIDEME